MELKLTNVARASIEELRLDYEDFLRQRKLLLWHQDDPKRRALVARRCATTDDVAQWIKEIHDGLHGLDGHTPSTSRPARSPRSTISSKSASRSSKSIQSISSIKSIKSTYPEIAANAALVLIGVTCALLDCQISAQAKAFESEGGFTERLHRIRSAKRKNK